MIHAVYVLNKAGQLIYQKNFTPSALPLTLNDFLHLGGLFHGMHLISGTFSPTKKSSGILLIETDKMVLRCLQVPTGTKFYITADPNQLHLEAVLKDVYELYIDYALKNPFYDIEQPIQNVCDKFVTNLEQLVNTIQKGGLPPSLASSSLNASSSAAPLTSNS